MLLLRKMVDVITWSVLLVKQSFAGLVLGPGSLMVPAGITATDSTKLIHSQQGMLKLLV